MTSPYPAGLPTTSVRHAPVSLPGRPAPRYGTDRAAPSVSRGPAGTLIAAAVLQSGQALMWMFVGLLIGMGRAHVPGEPVAVVIVIAAVGAFAIGVFVLALAAGTLSRSDVCRIASLAFQAVTGILIVVTLVELLGHSHVLRITFDPHTGPAFLVRPGFVVAMFAVCLTVAVLLACRQSSWATRGHRYRSIT